MAGLSWLVGGWQNDAEPVVEIRRSARVRREREGALVDLADSPCLGERAVRKVRAHVLVGAYREERLGAMLEGRFG